MSSESETRTPSIEQLRENVDNPVRKLVSTYCRPYLIYFAFSGFAVLVAQVLWLFIPVIIGVAFDAVFMGSEPYNLPFVPNQFVPETTTDQFWFSLVLLATFYIGASVLSLLSSLAQNIAAYRLQHDLRTDAYIAMQNLDSGFFHNYRTGDLMSTLNNDVNNLEGFFTGTFDQTINAAFIFLVAVGYMVFLNWQLALIALIAPLLNGGLNYWYSRFVEPRHQQRRGQVAGINNRIENNISGMDLIKIYTRESHEAERVSRESEAYKGVSWDIARTRELVNQITAWLPNAGYTLLFLVGGYWVLYGPVLFFSEPLAAGTLLAFLIYNNRLSWPLKQVTNIIDSYQEVKASSGRIFGILHEEPSITDKSDAIELEKMEGIVEYEDVSFAYPGEDEWTLSNVSLKADAGEMIGLVGSTGAGKSTLVRLLMRFYDVDEGTIRVDDHDIRDVTLRSLRQSIGYVGQEPYLFNGTIRENITYSGPDADDDAVREAARRAGIDEFVSELPDGYDTEIGERGVKLSGGQRQRISIARAIFNDPEILILDEATSHVDNETEALIQANLENLIENRTTFVIAHRLSTVRSADRILVLKDGEVVERGKHDELLERDGVYADLWNVQVGQISELPDGFVRESKAEMQ